MPPGTGGVELALWLSGTLVAGFVLCVLVGVVTGVLVAFVLGLSLLLYYLA